MKIENISVEDGILEISFNNSIGDAILFGLKVEQISTSLPTGEVRSPKSFRLFQNFPNPFNPETTIRFELPHAAFVRLNIYDARGALIHKVLQAKKEAGQHDLRLNLNLASGIYFYELEARTAQTRFRNVKKMVLLK